MLLMEPSSVSDARVFYGGHQFALALFLLFALRRVELVRPALILVILIQLTLSLSRLLIAWNEGGMDADSQLFGVIYRGIISGLAIGALYWLERQARPQPVVPAEPEKPREADFDGL
ncbi:hypothetical protein D3C80_1350990 [compost metagenome]